MNTKQPKKTHTQYKKDERSKFSSTIPLKTIFQVATVFGLYLTSKHKSKTRVVQKEHPLTFVGYLFLAPEDHPDLCYRKLT